MNDSINKEDLKAQLEAAYDIAQSKYKETGNQYYMGMMTAYDYALQALDGTDITNFTY